MTSYNGRVFILVLDVDRNSSKSLQRVIFFSQEYGCQIIQNFMLISNLKEYFFYEREKVTPPRKPFFLWTWAFSAGKTVFSDYLFIGNFFLNCPSELKYAKILDILLPIWVHFKEKKNSL
jgi:hypothetical protein